MPALLRATLFLSLLPAGMHAAHAQENPSEPLKKMAATADPDFEVATIKPSDPADHNQGFRLKGRRLQIEANNMTGIICFAYSIQKSQVINAPKWFDEQRWDIEGVPDVEGAPSWRQYRGMLKKLLSSRFGIQMHQDKRELSVYTLTLAKDGPKFKKSTSVPDAPSDQSGHGIGSQQYMKFTNASMTDFAQTMQLMVDKPVVDQTSLAGRFDFELLWTPDMLRPTEPNPAPALFTAVQEQLGLKLQATRTQTDVLVIDTATPPTQN